jgi:predicted nucleic acid-binding protein
VTYLLDTSVLSELRKPVPADHVVEWFDDTPPDALYLSVIVIGELRHGAERVRGRSAFRGSTRGQPERRRTRSSTPGGTRPRPS